MTQGLTLDYHGWHLVFDEGLSICENADGLLVFSDCLRAVYLTISYHQETDSLDLIQKQLDDLILIWTEKQLTIAYNPHTSLSCFWSALSE